MREELSIYLLCQEKEPNPYLKDGMIKISLARLYVCVTRKACYPYAAILMIIN